MIELITVFTGEVKVGNETVHLKSSPIGSCVVVVLFDNHIQCGGMAHIMLPGAAPEKKIKDSTKYAQNAIEMLLCELAANGLCPNNLKAVVVGGGNVLKRQNDTIGADNLNSVMCLLEKHNIKIVANSLKGTERKSVRFDVEKGIIYSTHGDEPEKVLFRVLWKPHIINNLHYEKSE